jgi:hypothetical protein
MKKRDIKIGETYLAKVSGKLAPVRITNESVHGGWNAVNTTTGREVRIRSAARLRRSLDSAGPAPVPSTPEAVRPAPTAAADETPPSPCETDLKFLEFPSAMEAVQHATTNGGKAIRTGGRNLVTSEADDSTWPRLESGSRTWSTTKPKRAPARRGGWFSPPDDGSQPLTHFWRHL